MQSGDILTDEEAVYVDGLERLWDMLSDAVESGRLRATHIPDDYAALVSQMIALENLRYNAQQTLEREGE